MKIKQRGIIRKIEATGEGFLNKEVKYIGIREVYILEETEKLYKVKFVDDLFQRSEVIPKWWDKEDVELIK